MKKVISIVIVLLILLSLSLVTVSGAISEENMLESVDIFYPNENFWEPGVCYGRVIELQNNIDSNKNGWLLTTCEKWGFDGGQGKLSFPIFCSRNGGNSWLKVADITCDELDGMKWMPHLFELDRAVGDMPKGTILCAGTAYKEVSKEKHESQIRLYKSEDGGLSWKFVSVIASASAPNSASGVWEPFFIITDNGELVCYYSDCREYSIHSQKLVHQTSKDGVNWGDVVDDVAVDEQNLRPGMVTVAKMSNGKYIMTYEVVNMDGNPVYYRYSDDGLNWGDKKDLGNQLIIKESGKFPGSAPYVAYTPMGGKNGLVIVTATFETPKDSRNGCSIFISRDFGDTWEESKQPLIYGKLNSNDHVGYSNGMAVSKDGKTIHYVNTIDYTEKVAKLSYTQIHLDENDIVSYGIPKITETENNETNEKDKNVNSTENPGPSLKIMAAIVAVVAVILLSCAAVLCIFVLKRRN